MGDVLKPCPFCGGEAHVRTYRLNYDTMGAHVQCRKCDTLGTTFEDAYTPRLEAIAAWNTRAEAGCIAELVEALEAADKHFGLFAGVTINGKHDPDDVRVIAMIRATLAKVKGEAA